MSGLIKLSLLNWNHNKCQHKNFEGKKKKKTRNVVQKTFSNAPYKSNFWTFFLIVSNFVNMNSPIMTWEEFHLLSKTK